MKKALKAELTSLAHQILQLKSTEDIKTLKEMAAKLHDKLTILEFTELHFDGPQPTIGRKDIVQAIENADNDYEITPSEEVIVPLKDNTTSKIEEVREEAQPDLDIIKATEKEIKPNTLSQEEVEYQKRQQQLEALEAKNRLMKNDMVDIGGVSYDDLPEFEPIGTPEKPSTPKKETAKATQDTKKSKSLNDRLNTGIAIGLNDRLAFIKHLFNGSAGDYNRVLSQLNTIESNENAQHFLETVVKPDYKNWEGKELYENRFKEIVEKKFN